MLNCFSLEPSAGISELVGDDSNAVEIGIIVIDLVLRISPSVANGNAFKHDLGGTEEGVVIENFAGEGRNVVPSKRLSGDIERTLLEGRPLAVQIVKEVEKMVCSLSGRTHQRLALISLIRETHSQRLVDENSVPHDVPSLRQLGNLVLGDAYGPKLSERSKLRAGSGSSLQPQNERHSLVGYSNAVRMGSEEAVVHSGLSLGVVPVDFLIACINNDLPE